MSYSDYDSKTTAALRRAVKAKPCRGHSKAREHLIRILTGQDPCLPPIQRRGRKRTGPTWQELLEEVSKLGCIGRHAMSKTELQAILDGKKPCRTERKKRKQPEAKRPWCKDQKKLDKFRTDVQKRLGEIEFFAGEFIKDGLRFYRNTTKLKREFVDSRKKKLASDEVIFVTGMGNSNPRADPRRVKRELPDNSMWSIKFFPSYDALMDWAKKHYAGGYYFNDKSVTLTSLRKFFKSTDAGIGIINCGDLDKIIKDAKSQPPEVWAKRLNLIERLTGAAWNHSLFDTVHRPLNIMRVV